MEKEFTIAKINALKCKLHKTWLLKSICSQQKKYCSATTLHENIRLFVQNKNTCVFLPQLLRPLENMYKGMKDF